MSKDSLNDVLGLIKDKKISFYGLGEWPSSLRAQAADSISSEISLLGSDTKKDNSTYQQIDYKAKVQEIADSCGGRVREAIDNSEKFWTNKGMEVPWDVIYKKLSDKHYSNKTGSNLFIRKKATLGGAGSLPDAMDAINNYNTMFNKANSYSGMKYQWGGMGEDNQGIDCSGLVKQSFSAIGIDLPHKASQQYGKCTSISRDELVPGDLVFFHISDGKPGINHTGIYIGDGEFIASGTKGVRIEDLDSSYYNKQTKYYGRID